MTEFSDARIDKGVLFGSDDDLFLVGGGHEPLRFIKGDVLPPRLCSLIHDNIAQRSALAERHGAGFVQLVAPEKYIVQPENFPFAAPGHIRTRSRSAQSRTWVLKGAGSTPTLWAGLQK